MYIGLKVLASQLASMKLDEKENIVSRFQDGFKQMWVNNGNALSKLYAGTGALSQGGSKLMDGARSAARTIQNNLLDKDKQSAYDLLLHGTVRNTDILDRARLLLPTQYWNAPVPLCQAVSSQAQQFTYDQPLRVAVGTYNINGGKHFRSVVYKNVSLDDWLLDSYKEDKETLVDVEDSSGTTEKVIDVYAIGFEEMVDLDAKNIMNASKENAKEWALELGKTLNSREEKYCLLTFHQLVGVCLYVFVRPQLATSIRDVWVEDVKTGMGGATGNKGTVAISFTYNASSLVFLCSHFAAGQKEVQERNNDFSEAVKRLSFPNGRTVLSHDYVFWCGDFNYRINMKREEVKEAVSKNNYSELLAADQLMIEHGAGNVFQGFFEGEVKFPPTYKYDLFSDDYDTSEKARVPAWTDRVLWKRRKPQGTLPPAWSDGDLVYYGRADLKQSDHRPVIAVLDVQARVVDKMKREKVFSDIVSSLGPSDGTVISTPCIGSSPVSLSAIGGSLEEVVGSINSQMNQFGIVRYSRAVRGAVWTQFREGGAALKAMNAGVVTVGGVEWQVSACTSDWSASLAEELVLVSNPVLPLAKDPGSQFRRESAKLLTQLSQLSFKELEDISLNLDVAPAKPPPPRPAPPCRPPPPSTKPSAPPRPGPPPARPEPPKPKPPCNEEKTPTPTKPNPPEPKPVSDPPKTGGGFSDLFSSIPDPDIDSDIPISISIESLVSFTASGEATPAPTKPPLPTGGSVEEPVNYEPQLSPPPQESPTSPESPEHKKTVQMAVKRNISTASSTETESGNSTPTNKEKCEAPSVPSRLPPSRPPPGPPPAGPPPGPPPRLPSRPTGGPPPPIPRR